MYTFVREVVRSSPSVVDLVYRNFDVSEVCMYVDLLQGRMCRDVKQPTLIYNFGFV